jgi:hypothetical protein
MLLILTSDKDLTADFLIIELIERNLPYFRLNAEDLARAEYQFTDSGVQRITVGPRTIDLSDVTAVWYRRALQPVASGRHSYAERAFIAGEIRHLAFGMVWNPNILWVNPIDKVYVAEHKLYQLRIARSIGLPAPRTIVSSNLRELEEFASGNPNGTICKPIFHGLFVDNSDAYSVYTRRVSAHEFEAITNLECPVLLQEEVPRRSDLRVTFIGKHCCAAPVHTAPSTIDWRDPVAAARFSRIEISAELRVRCQEMLSILNLQYGAFDFIEKPDGELVFLEINPTGEWAWLENALGYPMRSAFIELFYGERYA